MIVWNVARASAGETLEGHAGQVSGLAFSADGATLYSGGFDSKIVIWDLAGSDRLGRPFAIPDKAETPALRTAPRLSRARDRTRRRDRRPDRRADTARALALPRHPHRPGMGYVPRSRLLVVGGEEGFLALMNPRAGRTIKRLASHRGPVFTPSFSADGRLLAALSDLDTVAVYALPSGRPVSRAIRYGHDVADISLSPDGRTVALTRPTEKVEILDVPTLRPRTTLASSESVWDFMRFTPDGRFLMGGVGRAGRSCGRPRPTGPSAAGSPATRDHQRRVGISVACVSA